MLLVLLTVLAVNFGVAHAATPKAEDVQSWDPSARLTCSSTSTATHIVIYRYRYVDCATAELVASSWASRRTVWNSGESIDVTPIRWSCSRVGYGYAEEAFGRPLPAGSVQCGGYRGVEFIRFRPRRRPTLWASLLTAPEVSEALGRGWYRVAYTDRWKGYDMRRVRPIRCRANVPEPSLAGVTRTYSGPRATVTTRVLDFPTASAARRSLSRLQRYWHRCASIQDRGAYIRAYPKRARMPQAVEWIQLDAAEDGLFKERFVARQRGPRMTVVSIGGSTLIPRPPDTSRRSAYRLSSLLR